jgi:hypothetical protein
VVFQDCSNSTWGSALAAGSRRPKRESSIHHPNPPASLLLHRSQNLRGCTAHPIGIEKNLVLVIGKVCPQVGLAPGKAKRVCKLYFPPLALSPVSNPQPPPIAPCCALGFRLEEIALEDSLRGGRESVLGRRLLRVKPHLKFCGSPS